MMDENEQSEDPMAFTPCDEDGKPLPWVLSQRDFEMFVAAIEADEEPSEKLKALLRDDASST